MPEKKGGQISEAQKEKTAFSFLKLIYTVQKMAPFV